MTESLCAQCQQAPGTMPVTRRSDGQSAVLCAPCWDHNQERRRQHRREQKIDEVKARFRLSIQQETTLGEITWLLPQWSWARFGNAEWRELASPKIVEAAEQWKPEDGNLVLCANTGKGKTSSVVARLYKFRDDAIADVQADREPGDLPRFLFCTGPELSQARSQHGLGKGEAPLVKLAMDAELLILDEVGYETMRDQVVFDVIDRRYRDDAVTIVTTGRRPAEFSERYGDSCWRKMTEHGPPAVEDFDEVRTGR